MKETTLEEPEGIEDSLEAAWGDYPLDAVFVRTEPRTVGDVVDRIERQRYILDPEFQRDFVWQVPKQSKLIESCIMRIPLPCSRSATLGQFEGFQVGRISGSS